MNWSKLLPSTLNPDVLFRQLSNVDHDIATQALRDIVILFAICIAIIFGICVLWQTMTSWLRTEPYLKATRDVQLAANAVVTSDLALCRELQHHLIEFSSRDGTSRSAKRRTVDAAEVFRESALGPAFSTSRLILAIPSILTGLGVLGTFVGLQLGIGSLDFTNLEASIKPLINSCAVAFSSSVWGVGASLLFSWWEKAWEGFALSRVHTIQNRVDGLFPRYVPEEALLEMERSSRGTEELLKGLAVAIGATMQEAIGSLGERIVAAVSSATAEGHGPLMEKSAELLSRRLTAELANLGDEVRNMAKQFSDRFNGASEGFARTVGTFHPTVEALAATVGEAQRTVVEAVAKLNSHENVMGEMAGAAMNIRSAADSFGSMNETLVQSVARNEEASKAQLLAAKSNERVADQFGKTGERWPEIQNALEDAARVMSSLDAKLKEQIGSMANQFGERFSGASDGLLQSVNGFRPTVDTLAATVNGAQRVVADAVLKLSAHEMVMQDMADAAVNIRRAAEAFGIMNETLSVSATRNEEASKAQLSAAQSNERVAEQFSLVGQGLPKISETVEAAAREIGSLGSPIRVLRDLVAGQPERQREIDSARATSESERNQLLLSMAGNLAEKVGSAAQQFAEVGALADKLAASATSLEGASTELAVFGQQVVQASKDQRDASEAARAAAASGERVAKAFEPVPGALTALTGGLTSAGLSVRTGAESARESYRELIVLQKEWFAGAELGLNAMKDRLQSLLNAYGEQVEGTTKDLMKQWTEKVAECLQSYSTQVDILDGGLQDIQSAISKLTK
jgi:hypothetical protein